MERNPYVMAGLLWLSLYSLTVTIVFGVSYQALEALLGASTAGTTAAFHALLWTGAYAVAVAIISGLGFVAGIGKAV